MIITTGRIPDNYDKQFDSVSIRSFRTIQSDWTNLINTDSLTSRYLNESRLDDFKQGAEVFEGEPVSYQSYEPHGSKKIGYRSFAVGAEASRIAVLDDMYNIIGTVPSAIGKAMAYNRDVLAWDLINSGFVSTVRKTIDGNPLFYTAHPLADGTSFSNMASSVALSKTSLRTALLQGRNLTDRWGRPAPVEYKYLVVVPELLDTANEIVNTPIGLYTADGTINTESRKGLTVVSAPFLTGTTQWGLMTQKNMHNLTFYWRTRPFNTGTIDPHTGSRMWAQWMDCNAEFMDPYGVYWSAGA